jgi:hypothetical protein
VARLHTTGRRTSRISLSLWLLPLTFGAANVPSREWLMLYKRLKFL